MRKFQPGITGRTNVIEGMKIPVGMAVPENTTLLMHFDGDILDATGNNTPTAYGTLAYGSGKFSQAVKLDGTNCIKIPYSDNIVFGTNDFTIAGWFYWNGTDANNSYPRLWSHQYRYSSSYQNSGIDLEFHKNSATLNHLYLQAWSKYNQKSTIISSVECPQNEWIHIAVVRSGSIITLYLNGKADGSCFFDDSLYQNTKASFKIGSGTIQDSFADTPYNFFNGMIDEFIIVNGTALWTEDFEVPEKPWR